MTKTMRLIHLAALTACASSVSAQELADSPAPAEMRLDPIGFPPRAYTGRTGETVYDNLSNVFANGTGGNFLGTCENVIDDCRFAPGPWASATGRVITEITYGIKIGSPCNVDDQVSIMFWDIDDLTFQGSSGAGTSMINPSATPLATITVDMPQACQFIWHFTTSLTGLPGGGVHVPDGDAGVAIELAWVRHGCVPPAYTDLSGCLPSGCASQSNKGIAFGSNSLEPAASATNPGTANPATVGSTSPSYGRDISNAVMCPNIGWFLGNAAAPVNTGNVEHRFFVGTPTTGPNTGIPTTYGTQILLMGASSPCGSADFNHDGDAGTDADIEAFFACLAGACCQLCGSADFNGDGDSGTDADIEAFFRVLAGGSC
jgi:hypothetical protein